jgi:hypothetical protein
MICSSTLPFALDGLVLFQGPAPKSLWINSTGQRQTAPAPTCSHWWGPLTEVVRRGPRPSLLPLFRHAGLRIIAARIDRCAPYRSSQILF